MRKNKKIDRKKRKAPFFVLAEKLMENLRILNKIKDCPNCKTVIEENMKICPKCGNDIKNKLTYDENMDYIRKYLIDVRYTGSVIIHEKKQEIKKLREIIRDQNLEMGKKICSECNGTGIIYVEHPGFMFAFNPNERVERRCSNCRGKGIIQ